MKKSILIIFFATGIAHALPSGPPAGSPIINSNTYQKNSAINIDTATVKTETVSTTTVDSVLNFSNQKTANGVLATFASQPFIKENPAVGGAFYMGYVAGVSTKAINATNATAVGNAAMSDAAGNNNSCSAFGASALTSDTIGFENSAFGAFAGSSILGGASNDAFGFRALWKLTSGNNNVGMGEATLENVTTGGSNTGVGYAAGASMSGSANSATLVGAFAGGSFTNSGNTCVGANCFGNATTPTLETGLGTSAGQSVTTGDRNVLIGYTAGNGNNSGIPLTTGAGNILIGFQADALLASSTNSICIGYNCVATSSNTAQIGGAFGTSTAVTLQQIAIKASSTTADAATGNYAEYVSSYTVAKNTGGTGTYANLVSMTLTAGDWDIIATCDILGNGATFTTIDDMEIAVSQNSASVSGTTEGKNYRIDQRPLATVGANSVVSESIMYRQTLSTTTTLYFVVYAGTFGAGQPQAVGGFAARRAAH